MAFFDEGFRQAGQTIDRAASGVQPARFGLVRLLKVSTCRDVGSPSSKTPWKAY
jgi:hypothetical protein